MPAYFLDASALVKAYTHEPGSRWVRQVLGRSATRAFISPLSGAEVLAAIARKERLGELDLATRDRVAAAFRKDYRRRFAHTALTASVIEKAMTLVLGHPLRGYDAVQLASALLLPAASSQLRSLLFVSADSALLRVARQMGLAPENPLDHP
ncbi:MAG: type II toxin-antitoxin system VapC family toxin [candidate division NC10 bacterium]